jgi:hypothetical protein
MGSDLGARLATPTSPRGLVSRLVGPRFSPFCPQLQLEISPLPTRTSCDGRKPRQCIGAPAQLSVSKPATYGRKDDRWVVDPLCSLDVLVRCPGSGQPAGSPKDGVGEARTAWKDAQRHPDHRLKCRERGRGVDLLAFSNGNLFRREGRHPVRAPIS